MQNNKIAAIVLAAGQGTRMKSNLPKVMHKVMGRTMIKNVISTAEKLKAEEIIAVIAPHMDDVKKEVEPYKTAIQSPALGTGHAALCAKEGLKDFDGDIFVLYGDSPAITAETLTKMVEKRNEGFDVVVLGFEPDDAKRYGRLDVQNGQLQKIVEFKDATDEQKKIKLCNSGFMFMSKRAYDLLDNLTNDNAAGEYYLTDLVELANNANMKCGVVLGDMAELSGADNREGLAYLEKIMQDRKRKEIMESGVTLVAPETVYFAHDTKIGKDTIIEPNVIFGEGVEIGENTVINAFSHIVQGKIGDKCLVEPFCRVRKGTDIGERTKIGSFCEFKNAKVGVRNRFSHLSYIGDAEIGDYNIFGGGTITCNVSYDYNGTNKRKTKVGSQVFLGSNSILLAPVTIGDNAITAANSAIYKDVEKDALAITRAKQRNIAKFSITKNKTQQD
jgi:bifunctional UDP-N-acetylglucosamine pyrophosphorylase/glucosamine-1-phosphate N-acetyltransferase